MENSKEFLHYLNIEYRKHGLPELEKQVARGAYIGERLAFAEQFIEEKKAQQVATYQRSAEYSAIRQANAAEQSNKTAHRAYVVSLLAAAMSLAALLLQLFPRAG